MTSREICAAAQVADALRRPLREVITRVEWTYFGGTSRRAGGLSRLPLELQHTGAGLAPWCGGMTGGSILSQRLLIGWIVAASSLTFSAVALFHGQ